MTRLLLTCLGSLLLCQGVASADVTGVAITSDAALGTFAGKPYREGRLEVSGRAPGGPYRVPVTIAYPTRPADSNGAALVDVPDTTASAPLVAARADLGARRGMPRGAPLGAYGGLLRDTADPLLSESGTFTRFPESRLRELYPTHEDYVERVTRAADRLLARRYLLKAGRDAYVRAARRAAVP